MLPMSSATAQRYRGPGRLVRSFRCFGLLLQACWFSFWPLPRPFFAFLSGCFVAQNCGQVDTWIRGLTYGFGLDFAPWPTSPLGRRLPRWGLRASRSSSAAVSASWLSKRVSSPGRPATGGRRRATRGPRRCTSSARRRADPESGTIKQFFDGSVPSPAQDLLHRAKSAQPQTDDCRFL